MAIIYDIDTELTLSDNCFMFLSSGKRVLEFGSATGYATKFMVENFNCEVTCIEKIPEMAEKCKTYAKKMIVADIEKDGWENELDGQFDFIIFADVLEHLHNPHEVLRRVIPFLKEAGSILTSIPNVAHNSILMNLKNGKFEYKNTGLLDNTHIYFFTRRNILSMFNDMGLYLTAEQNKEIRPCETEFETFYSRNLFFACSIISRDDAHTYRFVQKWSKIQSEEMLLELNHKLPFGKRMFELLYDFACLIKRKNNLSTPSLIKKILQKT